MARKLIETGLWGVAFSSRNMTTSGTLYNGGASGAGIDTKDYDEVVYHINPGPITAPATLAFSVLEHSIDDASAATAVTSATFTTINNANGNTGRVASVVAQSTKRYQWLQMVKTSATASAIFGATYMLGRGDASPETNSEDFAV